MMPVRFQSAGNDVEVPEALAIAAACVLALTVLALAGCGLSIKNPALFNGSPAAGGSSPSVTTMGSLHGHVAGGPVSISGSMVQLYAVGTKGLQSAATPLITSPEQTDANGDFTIAQGVTCPSASSMLYLVATGGNAGLASGRNNEALSLMTWLGPCNTISSAAIYRVNEATTVASVWPLSSFMRSATQLGAGTLDGSFADAVTSVSQLINLPAAVAPGVGVPAGYAVQTAKLNTLATALDTCVTTTGGKAGDGSACGQLFSLATAPGGTAPATTMEAALILAKNNQLNVQGLFQLVPLNAAIQPVLEIPPTDWNLNLVRVPAAPTFTPSSGSLPSGQQIAISSATSGAAIHYTLDGSIPSMEAPLYSGALVFESSETVHAVAVVEDIESPVSAASFTVDPAVAVAIAPQSATLSGSETQQFVANVTGSANGGVMWALSPAVGTISASGLYAAPRTVGTAQAVTVAASSVADPSKIAKATIMLSASPVVTVNVSPGNVMLMPSQSQQFAAAVTGNSNTSVAWTLSPAVGKISAGGLYTAPASISSAQTITVSAISVADPTKSGTANIVLSASPVVNVGVSPSSVTLAPSQSQQFTAAVLGSPTSGVSWAAAPVGTISASGFYTAPASIVGIQNVTVTATSVADATKVASGAVTITPGGSAFLTYYVDNVHGSDSNAGTSADAPLLTIAKVNTLNLQPGQTVAFKAGETWHEMLTVSKSGSAGLLINYTSYGAGDKPVLAASDPVTGWSQGGTASLPTLPSFVWAHPQATDPLLIDFAGQAGTRLLSSANISAPLQFAYDGSIIYVYSVGDPTTNVEIPARRSALTSSGSSYIEVSNLELRGGTEAAFCGVASPCTNWVFENDTFDSAGAMGLHWALNNGVSGGNLTINNNTFTGLGGSGISLANGGSAMGDIIMNNTMTDLCKVYAPQNQYCDAINIFSQTGTDGGGKVIGNTIAGVGLNSSAAFGGGIHPDTVINWDIENNRVSNTNYSGIELEKGSGSVVRHNLVLNSGQYQYAAGLLVRSGEGISVSDMTAEYNTVVGGYWACALGVTQDAGFVTATAVTISQNICLSASSGTQLWLDPGYINTGNSFVSNGFGDAAGDFVSAANKSYSNYQALPSFVVDSLEGDPQFVSPAAGNYHLEPSSPDLSIGAFPE